MDEAAAGLGERGLAAMFVDPAFTADGILAPPHGYLREAARRVRAHGGLLIADEVQAGHGRCGSHLWSFQPSGIEPDMVVMGKPMGNGFPVAALVARSDVLAAVPEETELFSTFGGNPVACAAALAVLAVIEDEGLTQNAAEVGGYLREGLLALQQRHPVIGDVRGEGLLLGVELVEDPQTRAPAAGRADQVTEAMRDRGILLGTTGPAGNVLKIRPPLVFRHDHADLLLDTLAKVLAASPAGSPAQCAPVARRLRQHPACPHGTDVPVPYDRAVGPRYDVSEVPPQGGYLAKQCPVRAQWDLIRPCDPLPVSRVLERRFAAGRRFEAEVVAGLAPLHPDACMVAEPDRDEREAATAAAMKAGAPVIVGGRLPADAEGRRVGEPDLLVAAAGSGYRPVDIKHHRCLDAGGGGLPALRSALDRPGLGGGRTGRGLVGPQAPGRPAAARPLPADAGGLRHGRARWAARRHHRRRRRRHLV